MSLLLLFISEGAAVADDFCNLLQENGGELLTEAGADIVGEHCAATPPTTGEGSPRKRVQPELALVLYWDDEEALIVLEG